MNNEWQAIVRGFLCRRRYRQALQRRDEAVIRIQVCVDSVLPWDIEPIPQHLQALARGCLTRRRVKKEAQATIKAQAWLESFAHSFQ